LDQPVLTDRLSARSRTRCLLVDDHTLVRQGVRRLLDDEPDFEVVDEASNATEAMQKVLEHVPDLILMDVGMPGLSPFEAARVIQRDSPSIKVLFLTMHEDEEYVMQALSTGATGYVLKDASAAELIHALREVRAGGQYISPRALHRLTRQPAPSSSNPRLGPGSSAPTPREREVIKMIAEGKSAKEIAGLLGLSVKTVEAHKFNLMRKLNIHNKAQLVTYAIQKKIVKMPVGA